MRRAKIRTAPCGKALVAVASSASLLAFATVLATASATPEVQAREKDTSQTQAQRGGSVGSPTSKQQGSTTEPSAWSSAASDASRFLFDGFDRIRAKPDGSWYVINWGSKDGHAQRREGRRCGSDSCVLARRSGGVSFAELSVFPSRNPGFYENAEFAEQRTGYAFGQPGRWKPTPGHPVVLNARVRWSANHKPDGSGGAQGSSGVWFWNSPVDVENPSRFAGLQAFGVNWVTEDSALLPGLNASVVTNTEYGPYPVWSAAPSGEAPPDLQEWNDLTMLWSEGAEGRQAVRFWFGGEFLGETGPLSSPLGPLSLEIWSDNQVPTQSGIEYRNPSEKQGFDVDYVAVARL